MITEPLPIWLVISVISVALVSGIACISTSNIVWYRKQIFATGGTVLSLSGVILIGLSVWGNVQIEAEGWKINLKRVATALSNNPEAATAVISEAIQSDPSLASQLTRQLFSDYPRIASDTITTLAMDDPVVRDILTATWVKVSASSKGRLFIEKATHTTKTDSEKLSYCDEPPPEKEISLLTLGKYTEPGSNIFPQSWYKFVPSESGNYTVNVLSNAGKGPVVKVFGPNSSKILLGEGDNSDSGRNSRFSHRFEENRYYYICVSFFNTPRPFRIRVHSSNRKPNK